MPTSAPPNRSLRVLVAEDELVIGIDLAERIAAAGHSVLGPFTRRAEIVEWIAHDLPDAAVLDLQLLDGSCEGVVRQLRDRGVPIVAFTGSSDVPKDLVNMLVVTKTGSVDHVLAALKRLTAG